MWLTDIVYSCPICNEDITIRIKRIADIRRKKEMKCHNAYCPSNTGKWDEWLDEYHGKED